MKKLQIILILLSFPKIASGQYSPNRVDTLCLNLNTAKRLAFYKVEYKRLTVLTLSQADLIKQLETSLTGKRKMLDTCYTQLNTLQEQIGLLIQKHSLECKKAEINNRTPFFVKVKWISIGVGIGALAILSIN